MTHCMIDQVFIHVKRIGPVAEGKLKQSGYTNWLSVLSSPEKLPLSPGLISSVLEEIYLCQDALENDNIQFLIDRFPPKNQWRILAHYFERCSYFDIETNGLSYDSHVTMIVCYHQGTLYKFVRDENLDDFLDFIETIDLLVSFNGTSFDIPWLLRTWNIPDFPCPHIDLRWICYHQGLRGGLKSIEKQLKLHRPIDLREINGSDAVWLWNRWIRLNDQEAKNLLIRYCAADVISLAIVAQAILKQNGVNVQNTNANVLWEYANKYS